MHIYLTLWYLVTAGFREKVLVRLQLNPFKTKLFLSKLCLSVIYGELNYFHEANFSNSTGE